LCGAAGQSWPTLVAAARSVKSSQLRGIRVTNPVGLMLRQAETFAAKGVPDRFKPPAPVVVVSPPKSAQLTPEQEAEDEIKLQQALAELRAQYPSLGAPTHATKT